MTGGRTGPSEQGSAARRRRATATPRLHVICPDDVLRETDAVRSLAAVLDAGTDDFALHLRPRETPVRRCLELARRLVPIAEDCGSWLVINGRTDVARIARPQAVQLGHGALPVNIVRDLLGPGCAIGVSAHSPGDCRRAEQAGADYLLLGTIFPTPSHPGEPGSGLSLIARCAGSDLPLIAIGGIDGSNVAEVLGAGAYGAAVVRAVWEAGDPVRAVRRLRASLERVASSGA